MIIEFEEVVLIEWSRPYCNSRRWFEARGIVAIEQEKVIYLLEKEFIPNIAKDSDYDYAYIENMYRPEFDAIVEENLKYDWYVTRRRFIYTEIGVGDGRDLKIFKVFGSYQNAKAKLENRYVKT